MYTIYPRTYSVIYVLYTVCTLYITSEPLFRGSEVSSVVLWSNIFPFSSLTAHYTGSGWFQIYVGETCCEIWSYHMLRTHFHTPICVSIHPWCILMYVFASDSGCRAAVTFFKMSQRAFQGPMPIFCSGSPLWLCLLLFGTLKANAHQHCLTWRVVWWGQQALLFPTAVC